MKSVTNAMFLLFVTVVVLGLMAGCADQTASADAEASSVEARTYRFVVIPKVVHPWFDQVNHGAQETATALSAATGHTFEIDYRAPETADVVVQNEIIERAIATRPDGIAVDLLDPDANRVLLREALDQGIPVVIFDSESPEGMGLTKVGNDFYQQGVIASERLAELLNYEGRVAIMQGVPTAPNHRIRAEAHRDVFARYPGIEVVAEGIDNDSIEQAQQQAAAIMSAHPDLDGFVATNAAGPIGIGLAIREAGRVGDVLHVGMDDLNQLVELIADGVVESSSSTKPKMQGSWTVITLWMETLGIPTPMEIDTGIAIVTRELAEGEYTGF
ncbi:MAG: substrate-binding domain-containing protein [Spirochaetales bacterium]|nr:substrate-binding domain-containing protein [Spirochaetales bacterium]